MEEQSEILLWQIQCLTLAIPSVAYSITSVLVKPQIKYCHVEQERVPFPFNLCLLCTRTNKAKGRSFLSQGMIDFHLNENREAIMLSLLVFSQSSPALYLIREILSLPLTPSFFLPVWGINLTLYGIQRAVVFTIRRTKVNAFQNETERGGKGNIIIHGGRLICCLARRCSHWLFPLVSFFFTEVEKRGNRFFISLLHCLLSFLMGQEQKVSDKWIGEWSEHWAGLVWICMVCLTHRPFHTDRSVPQAPNQTQIQFHRIAGGNNFLFQVVKKKGGALAVLNYPF